MDSAWNMHQQEYAVVLLCLTSQLHQDIGKHLLILKQLSDLHDSIVVIPRCIITQHHFNMLA